MDFRVCVNPFFLFHHQLSHSLSGNTSSSPQLSCIHSPVFLEMPFTMFETSKFDDQHIRRLPGIQASVPNQNDTLTVLVFDDLLEVNTLCPKKPFHLRVSVIKVIRPGNVSAEKRARRGPVVIFPILRSRRGSIAAYSLFLILIFRTAAIIPTPI